MLYEQEKSIMVSRHYHDLKTRIYSQGRQIKKKYKEKSETEWELIDEKKKAKEGS